LNTTDRAVELMAVQKKNKNFYAVWTTLDRRTPDHVALYNPKHSDVMM
jgi:hypothetical protein